MPITVGSLSDAGDTDFQKVCSHSHNLKCEYCEKLKSVLEEVKGAISEAKNAAAKIFEWRGHILRAKNQDQYRRQIVDTLKTDETFLIVDWTMKFIAMKFMEKQAE